jgi:hypothetical protein
MPDFVKFSGDDNRTTWEHISQYTAQLGEVGTHNSLKVRLFSLSLTGTAFAWFSSLAPNSIDFWDQLEQKFHDHFFSGSYQLKLRDLTSVRQNKEESVSDYLKRFKEVKNHCFNLSLTDSDLANLAARGLRPAIRDRLEGVEFHTLVNVLVRGMAQELKLNKEKNTLNLVSLMCMLLNMIPIVQTMRMKCMLLKLYGLQSLKLVLVHLLSRLLKVGKEN